MALSYYGGKTLYAKDIAACIEEACKGRRIRKYIEPFCGWCSVVSQLRANGNLRAQDFVASDYNKSIVHMWRGLSRHSWKIPDRVITKHEWEQLRDARPSALKGFVGVVYSFNGRYFNWYRQLPRAGAGRLQERADALAGVAFLHRRYDDPDYLEAKGCAFYLDPPYKQTLTRVLHYRHDGTGGKLSTTPFDHDRFWEVAKRLSKHNVVVVSEYQAPPGWRCVRTLQKKGTAVNAEVNSVNPSLEKLFMFGKPERSAPAAKAAPPPAA